MRQDERNYINNLLWQQQNFYCPELAIVLDEHMP